MEILIAVLAGTAILFIFAALIIAFTPDSVKLTTRNKLKVDTVCDKVLKSSPEIVANKLGIATDKYMFNCNILGIKPNVERIIIMRIIAIIFIFISTLLMFLINDIFMMICILTIALAVSGIIFIAPTATVQSKAKAKQEQFESEIPRFLDLLQTALKIDLPIVTAIKTTAESTGGVLADELLESLAISEVGTSGWQKALYGIATKYEVDAFSDFVLDIITAYEKGSSIVESVERQSRDIKQSSILKAKEDAAKMSSVVLLPIVFFKMIPLMVILFAPVVMRLLKSF